jgi:hypothetical protein
MRLKEKKTALYGFLLIAAAVGLIVDRSYSPRSAEASPLGRVAELLRDDPKPDEIWNIGPPMANLFVLPKFKALCGEGPNGAGRDLALRDAFDLSPEMRGYYCTQEKLRAKQEQTEAEKAKAEKERAILGFLKLHQLQGTFTSKGRACALINGELHFVGDRIDGFRLTKIAPYRAWFEFGSGFAELELPKPSIAKVGGHKPR